MRRLNGVDALLLYSEAPGIHMHTLKIGILDVSALDGGLPSSSSAASPSHDYSR